MTRVLVVEDDAIIGMHIADVLVRLGYEVPARADDSDSALRGVAEHKPDLVLMDVQLRGSVDGIETVSRIRKESDVPVIFLTAHSDESTLARAKEAAPYGYLVKPFNERDLRTAIEVAIRKHEIEQDLAERERWFSTTLASLGDAVIATDPDERITFMNPVAQAITGFSMENARGRRLDEVFRLVDVDGAPLDSRLSLALRDRFTVALPPGARLVDHRGDQRLVADTTAPIVDDRGSLLGGVVVFRDVTEQKKLERRFEMAKRLTSLGTMAAGIAHEMNNPLAAVIGNVFVVLQDLRSVQVEGVEQHEAAGRIERCIAALDDTLSASERLRKIIATMRWFIGEPTKESEVLDLVELLETALALTHSAIHHKARLVRTFGQTPLVDIDKKQMVQVFANLLGNAVDAIPEGRAASNEIGVRAYTDGTGRAVVEIEDTGAGIRPSDLERIFDPFFSTKDVGAGMGLGLSLCHAVVTAAGGEIGVDSHPGLGTKIRISLPPAASHRLPKSPEPPEVASQPRRILVVDDEPIVAKVIQRMLSEHDVVVEIDPRAAFSRITRGERFDVFFCDVMMPVMSGMDLYESIGSSHPEIASRMVFLTGGAFTPKATEFLETVRNTIITKPFTAVQLREAVDAVVASTLPDSIG